MERSGVPVRCKRFSHFFLYHEGHEEHEALDTIFELRDIEVDPQSGLDFASFVSFVLFVVKSNFSPNTL